MKNFAKSILNYFAAFNETRFRFNRKLPYEWSDDSFTLDLSVFPNFQRNLLDAIEKGEPFSIEVLKNQYTVVLDGDGLKAKILDSLKSEFNHDFLQTCINQAEEQLKEITTKEVTPEEDEAILHDRALADGLREYNLSFRRYILKSITEAEENKVKDLREELGFKNVPPSSFNPQREVQRIYDDLQRIAGKQNSSHDYPESVSTYINHRFPQCYKRHIVPRSQKSQFS